MEITRKNWMQYIQNLAKADDKAAELITDYLYDHEILSEKGFQAFVEFYYAVVTKYAEGASEMAAQAYEALAEAQGAYIESAMPAETPSLGECIKTICGTMLDSDQIKSLAQSAGRLVRRTGVDTTINNALRDGAEWAWVPSGDTCAFCMMLASNGWQKASKKAIKNGHAKHIHANCDCTYAIRFDGKSTVEGYDPDYYKAIYDNAEGEKWQDKLNSMRRAKYAANPEKYRLQSRMAYERRTIASHSNEYKEYLKNIGGKSDLSNRHKRILEQLSEPLTWNEYKSKHAKINDLAALTAATGDEFALFSKGHRRILLRGKGSTWRIPEELYEKLMDEEWKWEGHSHPVISEPKDSAYDRETLRGFTWQKKSIIINLHGETLEFTGSEQAWFNKYLGIKDD